MKKFVIAAGILLFLGPSARPEDLLFRAELSLKSPRSRDPVLGGARDKVTVQVWIPDGVNVVRGGMCNPFSKAEPPGKHWQAMARLWKFAIVSVDFDAVKKDEFTLLQTGLEALAKKSGHPELAHMPLCFTGMSRGGGMSMQLADLLPARTIASVPVCLEVGPASEATRRIPVMTVFGEKDGKQISLLLGRLPGERTKDARWAIAAQWGRKHEFALANNISFIFLDDVVARRMPLEERPVKGPVTLKDLPLEDGWLGDVSAWRKDEAPIVSWMECKTDRGQMCWFPTKRTAAVWQAFVSPSAKAVKILEPPGLGDGQPFVLHSADKPVKVRVGLDAMVAASAVQIWDAERLLAERREAPWEFEVSLKPGVHALIAAAIKEGQPRRLSRPHTIVVIDNGKSSAGIPSDALKPMVLRGHERWVSAVAFSPDGTRIASGSGDDTLKLWDMPTGKEARELRGGGRGITSVAFSADGNHLAAGTWDGAIKIWTARDGKEIGTFRGHKETVTSLAFSPDGKRIVSGSGDDTFRVWDAANGKQLLMVENDNDYDFTAVAFFPDNKRILAGDADNALRLWDAATGEELQSLEGHELAITAIAMSRDGRRIVSGSQDDTARVWDVKSGKQLLTLRGHADDVTSVAISGDGKRIVSGGDDKAVILWDAATGRELVTLRGLEQHVSSVALSADGSRVAAASGKVVFVWRISP